MTYYDAKDSLPAKGELCVVKVEVSGDIRHTIAYLDSDDKWINMLTGSEVAYKFRKVIEWRYFHD